jgi:hypothetical protein
VPASDIAVRLFDHLVGGAPAKDSHRLRGVSDARQRSGGVEKYSSIASRQAPEHGSRATSSGPD